MIIAIMSNESVITCVGVALALGIIIGYVIWGGDGPDKTDDL